ncbi:uncharacterized protein GGS22DRAFT_167594 [Annulohypoxylon maeteangense]|uniref:uncharacterized protein n=1 Tax=Annulohypoxylon maeteangense TaxID=1927788 RepID=UPI0020085817|nr:uncharacterized protein GGS22DRAFT_167594 [Annulohypoxylon maeteangense]KAI0883639.1 hypothetical protein GGS22DRAFT_167594 [Annulohypoxylon maeteangense]
MSDHRETFTFRMGAPVTFPKAPARTTPIKGRRVFSKPSETTHAYFRDTSPSPTTSSLSESEEETSPSPAPSPNSKANQMIGASYPIPPLERQYAPPTEELDVAHQLAKKPLPRSLYSSLQRAAAKPSRKPVLEDEETRAKKLADAKKKLLALAGQI